uniref:Uncharacterized protein n=1 Tax=Anisakis simplex TaxID=6269 RepID=A0A0M3KEA8_ANISI
LLSQASQQGENALRQQIQRCNEQREQFQTTIQNLNCDKQGLQRKCVQIEREMFQIRERFDEMLRNRPSSSECDHCKRFSSNVDFDRNRSKPSLPLSASKQKDSSCTNDELRLEVEQLRGEISTLRETLNEQIGMFGDERRRWEMERNKMLQLNPSNLNPSLSVYSNRSKPPPSSAISTQQQQQCVVSADQLI